MSKLRIGRDGFSLPLELVTSTQAILARKRSGKSYTASVEAEELLERKQQVAVIDPTGAWWGLRSSADGNGPGYSVVVFGGDHADAPLDFRAGKAMAAALVEHGFSAIFDIGNLHTDEQVGFVTDFCSELLRINRNAMHVFMDEADTFAPQVCRGDKQHKCLGTVSRLVKQGGIKGVGFTMITQRPASINKDVLSQVDLLTVLRMGHPLDIKAATDWLESEVSVAFAKDVKAALPSLPVGTAFFCSAPLGLGERVEVRQKRTFNSGATPKPGERKVEPKVLAQVDIEKLGKEISASVQRVKEESPEFLKKRIAELERSKASTTPSIAPEREKMLLERINALDGQVVGLKATAGAYEKALSAIDSFAAKMQESATAIRRSIEEMRGTTVIGVNVASGRDTYANSKLTVKPGERQATISLGLPKPTPSKERVFSDAEADPSSDISLSGPQRKIIAALRQFKDIGIDAPQRIHVCLFSGYSNVASTGFAKAISGLSASGLVSYLPGSTVALTPDGLRVSTPGEAIFSNEDLQNRIREMLTGPEIKIFDLVLQQHPEPADKSELMVGTGYSNAASTGFAKALSHLSSLGFISYPAPKKVAATSLCFIPS